MKHLISSTVWSFSAIISSEREYFWTGILLTCDISFTGTKQLRFTNKYNTNYEFMWNCEHCSSLSFICVACFYSTILNLIAVNYKYKKARLYRRVTVTIIRVFRVHDGGLQLQNILTEIKLECRKSEFGFFVIIRFLDSILNKTRPARLCSHKIPFLKCIC